MTDLEITKACAYAMGYSVTGETTRAISVREEWAAYDPLYNDAQAMALVKKFMLAIESPLRSSLVSDRNCWVAEYQDDDTLVVLYSGTGETLNRAICECVARMK